MSDLWGRRRGEEGGPGQRRDAQDPATWLLGLELKLNLKYLSLHTEYNLTPPLAAPDLWQLEVIETNIFVLIWQCKTFSLIFDVVGSYLACDYISQDPGNTGWAAARKNLRLLLLSAQQTLLSGRHEKYFNAFIPNIFQPMANLTWVSKCFIKHLKIADRIRLTGVYSQNWLREHQYWPWNEFQISNVTECKA